MDGDAGVVFAIWSTGGGLYGRSVVESGLWCHLVRRYTPTVVTFLTMYDIGSLGAIRTVPDSRSGFGDQVLALVGLGGVVLGPDLHFLILTIVLLLRL